MADINLYSPKSGQYIKDDGTIVNLADKINALYDAFIVNKNAGMQLTGRQSQFIGSAFTALAITDTAEHWSTVSFDCSNYDDITLNISNTLNQNAKILLQVVGGGGMTQLYAVDLGTITGGTSQILTKFNAGALGGSLKTIKIGVICTVAPNSGSISINILGRKVN